MMHRLMILAAVALLTVTACIGGASPAPTTAVPTPASPTAPVATAVATAAATPLPVTITTSVVDPAGSDELFVKIPAGWITITARDTADEASFGDWRAAHPEVPLEQAKAIAARMSSGGVALFAFDAERTVGGITPNLNITWIDAPVRDFEPWLVERAATVTKQYDLGSPLEYRASTPGGEGTIGGFTGAFNLSLNGVALAGSQMVVPMPDGRAAVLTFNYRAEQTDYFNPIVEALFRSLSLRS